MPRQAGTTAEDASTGTGASGRGNGPASGRELRPRGRRTMEKLLEAGAAVFASKGYHAARVDDIETPGDFFLCLRPLEGGL